ncbi:MAG TPA: DUF1800 domain-containing protein [Vicinamibacterales bacterium]|jgi:uncharacterized protein (DUF1800 family)
MTRLLGIALVAGAISVPAYSADRFDQRLTPDRQILHTINRLTFGARTRDLAEVRRLGVEKWIDLQLHPERIPENPELAARLKQLTTLELATWQILEKYQQAPVLIRPVQPLAGFTSLQVCKLTQGGTAEERRSVIDSLSSDRRQQFLAFGPPQALEGLADIQQEAAAARQAEQQARMMEIRKLMPPLMDLLMPDQIRIARTGTDAEKLALFDSLDAEKRQQVIRSLGPQVLANLPNLRRESMAVGQPQVYVNSELVDNKLFRALYSNRQLEEVLVDFWMNHFNVFNGKGPERLLLTSFERDAIRPNVLGHFRDLLLATARHPAMLYYLDNWQSQVPRDDIRPPIGPNGTPLNRPGLNENYGRELMELHTLGVDGGYTQQDVIAVARAFSGWTIYDTQRYSEFQFNPAAHDRKEKVVLGHTLPPGRGEQDGLDVIDILSRHPSTAKFISKKLAQRFVADAPPASLVDRMAATFTKTDGDLRAVLQTMFSSPEFLSEGAWRAKLKSPFEMAVSAVRALNADVTDTFALSQRIADLGQPLYGKVEPTGYPTTGETWANSAGLIGRIDFATALSGGSIPGIRVDMSRFNFKAPAAVASDLLGAAPTPATLTAIEKGVHEKEATPSMLATLVISSPDFQSR